MKTLRENFFKSALLMMAFVMVGLGTYNAVFMNSTSFMDQNKIVSIKRLDEVDGRLIAAQRPLEWKSIAPARPEPVIVARKEVKKVKQVEAKEVEESAVQVVEAVIKNELDLSLKEFYSAKKYQKYVDVNSFEGSLIASAGVIESMEVIMPDGESLFISLAQMKGNIFSYEHDGADYNAMIYEVGQGSYMVTLNDGPFAGARMKFTGMVDGNEYIDTNATPSAQPAFNNQNIVTENNAEGGVQQNNQNQQQGQFGFNFQS